MLKPGLSEAYALVPDYPHTEVWGFRAKATPLSEGLCSFNPHSGHLSLLIEPVFDFVDGAC